MKRHISYTSKCQIYGAGCIIHPHHQHAPILRVPTSYCVLGDCVCSWWWL